MTTIASLLNADNVVFVPAVVGYLQQQDRVLLGLRKRVSAGLGEGLVAGIGGKIGDAPELANETADAALVREFQEEVGVTPIKWENKGSVKFIFPAKSKWNQDVTIYTITAWEGQPQETEVIKPLWFPLTELPFERMWEDNQHWVPRALAGEMIQAVFLYDLDNKLAEYTFEPSA